MFRTRIHSSKFPAISGLFYQADFISDSVCHQLYAESLNLQTQIQKHQKGARVHTSQGHNLPFEKSYKLLRFQDNNGQLLNAQSFANYGSCGHYLTYFMNNENIPDFIRSHLISRINRIDFVENLANHKLNEINNATNPLNWRFTFNVYHHNKENDQQAGFGWHQDIAANGEITSITTIHGTAIFQIRPLVEKVEKEEEKEALHQDHTYTFTLNPGSLVMLSGDSRWKWEHRVLAQEVNNDDNIKKESIGRISLVLGCR